jgi:YegS/Rv2252/BmrU family lipid kinase
MKIKLIINPKAGNSRGRVTLPLLSKIKRRFQENGISVDLFFTKKKGDALREAKKSSDYDAIVVGGGDGTINEVVNGIVGSSITPLGIIPLGTVNLLAKEVGIPDDPIHACDVIIRGKMRRIDIGKAGTHYFTLMAGIGFDAEVIENVNPDTKRILGTSSYLFAGIKTLAKYRPSLMSIRIENKIEQAGYFVIISNAKMYADEVIRVARDADLTDGLLDVYVFKNGKRHDFLRYAFGILVGKHTHYGDVKYFKVKRVEIRAKTSALVHTDCEIIGKTPMEFTVLPKALKIIVPY